MLEAECLKPGHSDMLSGIGLALLKYVSSHKGLTCVATSKRDTIYILTLHIRLEIFDEYTRRQFVAKAPTRNPFGEEEEPQHFVAFDVFTKLRVLHQLSVWTLNNPDRIREKMEEEKEGEQTQWVCWRATFEHHCLYPLANRASRLGCCRTILHCTRR